MSSILPKLGLEFNPFEPAGAGAPLKSELTPPDGLQQRVIQLLDGHQKGRGVKPIVVIGEYGTGKTCLLRWLHENELPERRIKSFYFDNPGVQFYSLANTLLRTIGRKDFAKFIWELAGPKAPDYQRSLFRKGFEEYLTSSRRRRQDVTTPLQRAILEADVTGDDQIANCLARIVTDATTKPYFEYRDFMPRQSGSLVAESEEAPYFRAILKVLSRGMNATAVAFLIDEFEEIGLQKRLTRRETQDYLATLKRLISLAQNLGGDVDFWIVLSMTRDAYDTTRKIETALGQRFSGQPVEIEPLGLNDAAALMKSRLHAARRPMAEGAGGGLFPFPDDIVFRKETYSNPRRLVKTCFYAIAEADDRTARPFSADYLRKVEERLYPESGAEKR